VFGLRGEETKFGESETEGCRGPVLVCTSGSSEKSELAELGVLEGCAEGSSKSASVRSTGDGKEGGTGASGW